jgi:hypothetical protein
MGRIKQQRVNSSRARTRRRATVRGELAWAIEHGKRRPGVTIRYYAPGELKKAQLRARRVLSTALGKMPK